MWKRNVKYKIVSFPIFSLSAHAYGVMLTVRISFALRLPQKYVLPWDLCSCVQKLLRCAILGQYNKSACMIRSMPKLERANFAVRSPKVPHSSSSLVWFGFRSCRRGRILEGQVGRAKARRLRRRAIRETGASGARRRKLRALSVEDIAIREVEGACCAVCTGCGRVWAVRWNWKVFGVHCMSHMFVITVIGGPFTIALGKRSGQKITSTGHSTNAAGVSSFGNKSFHTPFGCI